MGWGQTYRAGCNTAYFAAGGGGILNRANHTTVHFAILGGVNHTEETTRQLYILFMGWGTW